MHRYTRLNGETNTHQIDSYQLRKLKTCNRYLYIKLTGSEVGVTVAGVDAHRITHHLRHRHDGQRLGTEFEEHDTGQGLRVVFF